MESTTTVRSLQALAHASRLAAFRALVQVGPGGMAVGELRDLLDLPPATLTAHLNVLRAAGLIVDTREGRVIRLRADYQRMNALIGYLTENCCGGVPCLPTSAKPARTSKKAPAPAPARGRVADKHSSAAKRTRQSRNPK